MRRRVLLAVFAVMLMVILAGCDVIKPAENIKPEATAAVIIKPIEIKAADTPTPEPVIVVRDPVKSHSPMRIQQDVPVNENIPVFYQAIDLEGVTHAVYAFMNSDGLTEFRVYAEVDELEDENVMNTLSGFFRAEVSESEDGTEFVIRTNKDENPINISAELPGKLYPCSPPTKNNVRAYVKNMQAAEKKYMQAVSNAEKKGEPAPEPTPWDGLPIYTDSTPTIEIPSAIKLYNRKDPTLYYYQDIYGDNAYRRYASPNGTVSGFCLSDESGKILPGSLFIDISLDFIKENFKGRKPEVKPAGLIYRLPVYITLQNGVVRTVQMVYQK